ncbi:hypothetical protein BDV32DRAFT_121863 [Aspergillus pseudonomiae]|nr:hypothetical protein BDV32DRAFT_121863 [Aspergillus pseudonomiae]
MEFVLFLKSASCSISKPRWEQVNSKYYLRINPLGVRSILLIGKYTGKKNITKY